MGSSYRSDISDGGECTIKQSAAGCLIMGRLIPDDFLTIRQTADEFAVAMYSGLTDRPSIKQHRRSGFDVADGAAVEEAISKIWAAVDRGTLQAFVVGPSCWNPLKLSARMSQAIPLLR